MSYADRRCGAATTVLVIPCRQARAHTHTRTHAHAHAHTHRPSVGNQHTLTANEIHRYPSYFCIPHNPPYHPHTCQPVLTVGLQNHLLHIMRVLSSNPVVQHLTCLWSPRIYSRCTRTCGRAVGILLHIWEVPRLNTDPRDQLFCGFWRFYLVSPGN